MNYIGSKKSLLPFLEESIRAFVGRDDFGFADLFAGTGIVGSHFKNAGHETLANDLQYYSYVLNRHYVQTSKEPDFQLLSKIGLDGKASVFAHLNSLEGTEGFVYSNYCLGGSGEAKRSYFTDSNGLKCDAIRNKIDGWKNEGLLTDDEFFWLLASLIESVDKVANTASVYGAYLKSFKKSAKDELTLVPAKFFASEKKNVVLNADVNSEEILSREYDVVYLDPPYNSRQYSGNYHVLETIARNDSPVLSGKTGMRDNDLLKSNYCSKTYVKESFEKLLSGLKANYVFVSYNDEGLLSLEEMRDLMKKHGTYQVVTKAYRRFKSDKQGENRNYDRNETVEYLHCLKKTCKV